MIDVDEQRKTLVKEITRQVDEASPMDPRSDAEIALDVVEKSEWFKTHKSMLLEMHLEEANQY